MSHLCPAKFTALLIDDKKFTKILMKKLREKEETLEQDISLNFFKKIPCFELLE